VCPCQLLSSTIRGQKKQPNYPINIRPDRKSTIPAHQGGKKIFNDCTGPTEDNQGVTYAKNRPQIWLPDLVCTKSNTAIKIVPRNGEHKISRVGANRLPNHPQSFPGEPCHWQTTQGCVNTSGQKRKEETEQEHTAEGKAVGPKTCLSKSN